VEKIQPTLDALSEEEADFRAGAVRLHRRSILPRGAPWARLVIFHGYGDHGGRYRHLMRWFAARGLACQAFDQRGHGKALGRRGFVRRWDEFLDDARAAMEEEDRLWRAGITPSPGTPGEGRGEGDFEHQRCQMPENTLTPALSRSTGRGGRQPEFLQLPVSTAPRFILGHSHGGLVVAMGVIRDMLRADGVILSSPYLQSGVPVPAGRLALARAVGLVMPWARFGSRIQETWISSDQQMLADSRADPLLLRTATPRWYVSMLAVQEEARRRAAEFRLPLLCLTGDCDSMALPAAVVQFYESAGSQEKKLIRYPGLLHELLRETQRESVFADILDWIQHVTAKAAGSQIAAGAAEPPDGSSGASL